MKTRLKIGIAGTGFIADFHYQGFSALENVEVAGICRDFYGDAIQQERQKQQLYHKCKEFHCKAYESFNDLASDPSIDAIIIGSINPYHFEQIISGLKAGKHLLVEKPIVTRLNQLDEIEQISKQMGKIVFPGHNYVYKGALQKARELLLDGKIGTIIHASFVEIYTISDAHIKGWRANKTLSAGGTLMDSGHHLVYQALFLLGMPVAIHAFASKMVLKSMEGEDTAQVSMQYADGTICNIMQSWASSHGKDLNGIRILGDKGSLVVSDALYLNGEKINRDADYGQSFKNQADAFIEFIQNGKPPLSTLEDARNALKIILSAYESIKSKTIIEF